MPEMNITDPVQLNGVHLFAISGMIVISLFGIVTNIPVIVISLGKDLVTGEYKYFFLHLACVDTVFCISSAFVAPIPVFTGDYNSVFCKFAGFLHITSIFTMILATFPLSINRYVKLYYSSVVYSHIFSNRNIFLICMSIDLFCSVYMLIYGLVISEFTRIGSSSSVCAATGPTNPAIGGIYLLIFIAVLLAGYTLMIFAFIKLRQKIKQQQTAASNLQQLERIKMNRDLLKVATLQAAMPFICQVPLLISIGLNFSLGLWSPWSHAMTRLVMNFNPIADAVATLYMIKPYKKALVACYKNIVQNQFSTVVHDASAANAGTRQSEGQSQRQRVFPMSNLHSSGP